MVPRLPAHARPPANLVAAAGLAVLAHRWGESRADLGLTAGHAWRSLPTAAVVAGAIVTPIAVGTRSERLATLFLDERVTGLSRRDAAFHLSIGIPVGTATAEEVMFRGALLALLDRAAPPRIATGVAAALFGVWHVVPALESLAEHPLGRQVSGHPAGRLAGVAGTVVATGVAGLAFTWLRRRTGSVLAPILAHAALNGAAFAAARFVARRTD
jgi:membrane protease YdiL (CAAX protease family)